MPNLTLYLIRHGATDWNEEGRMLGRSETPLNERGRQQAAAVAEALRSNALASILSSPQLRAQQTAAAIAAPQEIAVQTEADLAEVWVGAWQGQTFAELQRDPDLQRHFVDPTYHSEAIEDAAVVQQRCVATVERLRREAGGNVALVSHGDPLRVIIAHYLRMDLASYRCLRIDTGSVSVLEFGAHRHQLAILNWKPQDDVFRG